MKGNLLIYFFFVIALSFSQSEREVINQIDEINTKALNYYHENNIVEAYNTFYKALRISDSINDSYGNAVANFNLGRIYGYMLEYEDAEKCFNKMLEASLEIDDNYLIANAYLGLADLFDKNNQFEKVVPYYEKALDYALRENVRDLENTDKQNSTLFSIRMNLCEVYLKRNELDKVLINLLRAQKNLDYMPNNFLMQANYNYVYGQYFMKNDLYTNANDKFRLALKALQETKANKLNSNLLYCEVYKDMSKVYAKIEDSEMAYNTLLMYNKHREQFISEERVRQDNIAKSRFYLAEYKHQAKLANEEKLAQEQITKKVKTINLFSGFTVVILAISLMLLYRNYSSKRKLSQILKVQNEELEIAKEHAEKSSKLKSKFISNVTHELRTPLYGVVGLTSLLLSKNDLSARDSNYLKSLKYSGDYLLNLVNDILQIGKIESQKVELKKVTVNLKELVNNIKDSFGYRLTETNNKIKLEFDDNIPKFIFCDSVRLSQILINLIGNSLKFTENKTTTVKVKLLKLDKEKTTIRFIVKDKGPGIPKDKQESIFENFSQLEEESNINYMGTGLGLPITKNLLDLFGSNIELESELGKGSTFSFEITFEIDKRVKVEKPIETNGKTVPLNTKYRILVAEDNKINQIVTQNILKKGNFDSDVVKNGLEAVTKIKEGVTYDLILMDINMPIMGGHEATKEIRKVNPKIPIIALTASDVEEVKNDCESKGYNGVITKPFEENFFYQTIVTNIHESKKNMDNDQPLVKVS